MNFDYQNYPYPSKRNVTFAKNGMVNAGNPSAAMAGLDVLKAGGNAVDAAVAVASCMPVTEPTGNGLGADCFAIIYYEGKLYGLNGSGFAPQKISIGALKDRGHKEIPSYGVEPVGVPGAVGGWMAMHERFGRLSLEKVMEPAIRFAETGFAIGPNISKLWKEAFEIYSKFKGKKEFQGIFDTYLQKEGGLDAGDIFTNKDLAESLKKIAATKGEAFYKGELADKIDAFMKENEGFLRKEDLEKYKPQWVDPISVNYHGVDVWELPPNGHGVSVLMALKLLDAYQFTDRDRAQTIHKQIEAMKLSMTDTAKYVTDPDYMTIKVEDLLSDAYTEERRNLIKDRAIDPVESDLKMTPSTVYFCTADGEGNMVSMIQSNFRGFGSGIVVPGTGIALNDRLENFKFDEGHTNRLEGGKRPYHTIIPGFLTKNGKALGPFGIMGGFMQPQAHMQVVMNLIDFGLNPQQALDAPRFQWIGGKTVEVEQEFGNHLVQELQRMGHDVRVQPDPYHMGRGQIILKTDQGSLAGGTEKRTDGYIACY